MPSSIQRRVPSRLHGRVRQAAGRGGDKADGDESEPSAAGGRRVREERRRGDVRGDGAPYGAAAHQGDGHTEHEGLGGVREGDARRALPCVEEGGPGHGQPEHAFHRLPVRGLPARRGGASCRKA